jgi:antirestriction protein
MNEHEPQHNREPSHKLRPRVWVASLADYNAGRLHGEWLDAAVDTTTLNDEVRRILASSTEPDAEEWAIFDYDDFGGYQVNEYDHLEDVAAVARGIAEHGAAFAAWAEIHDGNPDLLAEFEANFLGTYASAAEWAREVISDIGLESIIESAVPDSFRGYVSVDYASFADDERLGGAIYIEPTPSGDVWIFRVV